MSVTLYHGPKSAKKDALFLELATKDLQNNLVLVGKSASTPAIKSLLLQHSSNAGFIGEPVLSWDQFLFTTLKVNLHGGHRADRFLAESLLFFLINTHDLAPHTSFKHDYKKISEIYDVFLQLKKCNVDTIPNFALDPLFDLPKTQKLFELYNQSLNTKRFFDDGDLYKTNLKILADKTLKLAKNISQLFVFETYPLNPGQREFLRRFKAAFPTTRIHIFYDEDFSRESDWLSFTFEDLGDIADENHFIENIEPHTHTLHQTKSPAQEIEFVLNHIEKDLNNTLTPFDLAIVTTSEALPLLKQKLEQKRIPYASYFAKACKDFKPSLSQNISARYLADNPWLQEQFEAEEAQKKFKEQIEFCENLFSEYAKPLSPAKKESFFTYHEKNLRFQTRHNQQALAILPLSQLSVAYSRKTYIMGLTMEAVLKSKPANTTTTALKNFEMIELLQLPHYQLKILLSHLENFLQAKNDLVLSQSLSDLKGKETTALPLPQIVNVTPVSLLQKTKTQNEKSYWFQNKTHFSSSEIETYLDCPYKYYLNYILNLSEKDSEEIEPSKKSQGNLIHWVLQTLYESHQPLIHEHIQKQNQTDALKTILPQILNEGLKQNPEFQDKPQSVLEAFTNKIQNTVFTLLEKEAEFFVNHKKQTLPTAYEWAFRLTLGSNTISGRIDRIDQFENEITVIDYKTGTLPTQTSILNLEKIQLPLYMLAAEQKFGQAPSVSAGVYYGLKEMSFYKMLIKDSADAKLGNKSCTITSEDWEIKKQNLLEILNKVIKNIQNKEFNANPKDDKLCETCRFARQCDYVKSKGAAA